MCAFSGYSRSRYGGPLLGLLPRIALALVLAHRRGQRNSARDGHADDVLHRPLADVVRRSARGEAHGLHLRMQSSARALRRGHADLRLLRVRVPMQKLGEKDTFA